MPRQCLGNKFLNLMRLRRSQPSLIVDYLSLLLVSWKSGLSLCCISSIENMKEQSNRVSYLILVQFCSCLQLFLITILFKSAETKKNLQST